MAMIEIVPPRITLDWVLDRLALLTGILGVLASIVAMFNLYPHPNRPTWGIVLFLSIGVIALIARDWNSPKRAYNEGSK